MCCVANVSCSEWLRMRRGANGHAMSHEWCIQMSFVQRQMNDKSCLVSGKTVCIRMSISPLAAFVLFGMLPTYYRAVHFVFTMYTMHGCRDVYFVCVMLTTYHDVHFVLFCHVLLRARSSYSFHSVMSILYSSGWLHAISSFRDRLLIRI